MWVIFDTNEKTDCAMVCFYNEQNKQRTMMHNQDIDKQVKEWQKFNSGNPPRFASRISIKRFTNESLNFSNVKL